MPVFAAIKRYCVPRDFDTALFRGYMFIYVYAWIMNSLFFALIHKDTPLAVASAIGAPLAVFATWLHERGLRNAATALRTLSALALISYIAYETGGVRSPVLVWNFIVVLGGLLVFGEKRGFVLLVASVIQVVGLYFAPGMDRLNGLAAFSFLNTIPFIYIVGVIFLRQKQLAFTRLQDEKAKVEIANQNIESILSSSPNLIAIFDANRIIVASDAFHKMFPGIRSFIPDIIPIFPEASRPALLEALGASLDNDELNFGVNEGCLPARTDIQGVEYSIKWTPIYGKDGIIRRIQFEANNVSEMFAQRARAEKNELIAAVFHAGVKKVRRFLPKARAHFQAVRETLPSANADARREAYVRLHTLKGEARTLGFAGLADAIHKAEDGLNAADMGKVLAHLNEAEPCLTALTSIVSGLEADAESLPLSTVAQVLRERRAQAFLLDLLPNLSGLLKAHEATLREVAKDLNLPVPHCILEGLDARLSPEAADALDQLLVHALRNALSHGLESPAERRAKGKAETGLITMAAQRDARELRLYIADDGRGLVQKAIRDKAQKLGLPATEDVAELIFRPGFSTSAQLSHISGRGVGMDAIRAALEKVGGSVRAEVLQDLPEAPWRLVVRIPKVHIMNWESADEETMEPEIAAKKYTQVV